MTAVLPSSADSHSRFPDPVPRPITRRYFLEHPDNVMTKPLPRPYLSDYQSSITSSAVSSPPSSPGLAPDASQIFRPTHTGSMSSNEPDNQDDELLPPYNSAYLGEPGTPTEPSINPLAGFPRSPLQIPAADDSSVEEEPSRHVDYLSYEWIEEDIWMSWRYIVFRKEKYENSVRLENASWRTWTKLKHNLGTISPDALNWLKDCDVTWLYGPLKTSHARVKLLNASPQPSCSESPSVCPDRKSILKKRTASETILQRSLSQHTLLQHAGAILKAQEAEHSRNHARLGIRLPGFEPMIDKLYDRGLETPCARLATNISSSGADSPNEKRHIHFNKEVLQCIAIAKEEQENEWLEFGGKSSWDNSYIVKPASPRGVATPPGSFSGENKTIAPLPPTTLKYHGDGPEPQPSSIISGWYWKKYIPGYRLYSLSFRETLESLSALGKDHITSSRGWGSSQGVDDSTNSWFVDSAQDDEVSQNFYLASLGFLPQGMDKRLMPISFDRMVDTVHTAKVDLSKPTPGLLPGMPIMLSLAPNYLERVYAGVLGKLIGVYLGRPSDVQDHLRTVNGIGSIRSDVPLVVTDDGVSGTFISVRALEEHGFPPKLTAEAIGKTWLNNVIENRTVFWWSGHGVSNELTTSHCLANGIPGPLRGAIKTNGPTIAEQIGAQAFIDAWALVAPGNPALAAKFAETAGSVSHGSESVYAAKLLAAMEAEAFVSKDVNHLLDVGLNFVPADSLIAQVTRDVRNWTQVDCDWEETRLRIKNVYRHDEVPGFCRAILNHGLIIMTLLYAGHNFQEALYIVSSAGRDTDCNSGNVGCLIAVMHGLASFEGGRDWLGLLADRAIISSVDGGYSANNAARIAFDLANLGRKLAGKAPLPAPKDGAQFHFTLPGSVQGFHATRNDLLPNLVEVGQTVDEAGHPGLAIRLHSLSDAVDDVEVLTPTFTPPDVAKMADYNVMASPLLYPGQQVKAFVRAEKANTAPVAIRIRLKVYGPDDILHTVDSPSMTINPGRQATHQWTIPTHLDNQPIQQVGLALSAPEGCLNGLVWLDSLGWSGVPHLCLRPLSNASGNLWKQAWVNGAGDFLTDLLPDSFFVSQDHGEGIIIYGTRDWTDYQVVVPRLTILLGGRAGIVIRVQGLNRYYALVFVKPNHVALVKALDGERIELAAAGFNWELATSYRVSLAVKGSFIRASIGGGPILEATDDRYLTGGIGIVVTDGAISANQFDVSQLN